MLLALLPATLTHAQQPFKTVDEVKRRAKIAFDEGNHFNRYEDYPRAIEKLTTAIEIEPTFINAYLLRADSYYASEQFAEAEADFEQVIALDTAFNVRIYYILALSEMRQSKYGEARTHLQHFIDRYEGREAMVVRARTALRNAAFAEKALQNPVPFQPINLGPNINSPYSEYLPTLSADGEMLLFTRRVGAQEDFYAARWADGGWQMAQDLGEPVNTPDNEGAETISADGRVLVFTACNRPGDYGSCDLYYAEKVGNQWTTPRNIGAPINSSAWESQPALSPDGRTLYFASNRRKHKDIYQSQRQSDGTWSAPELLPFNTNGDDEGPFIHADNQTLYFTSNGYAGMGGLDLFVVRKEASGAWGTPQNLGHPINTPQNEGALIIDRTGTTAYFASVRAEGLGGLDLYQFELAPALRPSPVTYVKAQVFDVVTRRPIVAHVEVAQLSTRQTRYADATRFDGTFLVCLPLGDDYALNVSRKGYLFHSENFALDSINGLGEPFTLQVFLQPILAQQPTMNDADTLPKAQPIVLNNIFFKSGSAELEARSIQELDQLVRLLQDNPTLNIQINGHTDDVGSAASNQALSEQRAQSVVNYLITNGIARQRLRAKGYGETHPIADNTTAAGRLRNRRTEFEVW